ncbi:MAG: hypothetical protein WC593_14740 [Methanoregula sp.]
MKQRTATGADWERGERGVVDEGTVFKWQKGMLSKISGKPDQDVRKKQISDLGERRVTEIFSIATMFFWNQTRDAVVGRNELDHDRSFT